MGRSVRLPRPEEWTALRAMAEDLVASGLLPQHIKTPQAALFVILKSLELGLPPTYGLSHLYVTNGRVAASAELMAALVYRAHGDQALEILETTDERCVVRYKRRGWKEARTFAFTREDARRAGLLQREQYQRYPAALLRARAVSAVCRLAFPDVLAGLAAVDDADGEEPEYLPDEEPALPPPTEQGAEILAEPPREEIRPAIRQAEKPAKAREKQSESQGIRQRLVKQRLREAAERFGVDYRFVVALIQHVTGKRTPGELADEELDGAEELLARHAEAARAIAEIAAECRVSPSWVESYLVAQGCAATFAVGDQEFVGWYLVDADDLARAREAARQHAAAVEALETRVDEP
ncbi:MAG: hypothetical protein NZ761_06220 [Dehalococcoidia bacterium]|nr:hypothetical protein [Dehalococcoidia bacterium]